MFQLKINYPNKFAINSPLTRTILSILLDYFYKNDIILVKFKNNLEEKKYGKNFSIHCFLCLAVASVFSLINTIVENKIFNAYVMIPLYSVAVISLILYLIIYKKGKR